MLKEEEMESGVLSKRGMEIVKGEGSTIWDAYGREYIDMGASYGVCNVGHCDPRVVDAIKDQSNNLLYVSSSYDNPARRDLMERLVSISPVGLSRVFLCNSGTESMEAALKFALKITGRKRIVAAKRAFHGRTMGSLSLTFNPSHRKGMEELLIPVDFASYGSIEEMDNNVNNDTAAVILEPVQGEGGVHVPPDGYLKEVQRICEERGALLIIDEVQSGLGRTGRMFAVEHHDVIPDMMCIGKSLGGGLPIAAVLIHERLGPMQKGLHGSTFGGDPLTCAAANACLETIIEKDLSGRSAELGEYFLRRLNEVEDPLIKEVRGRGLMIGVQLKKRAGPYLSKLLKSGIAAIPAGATVIRFLPPLVVSREEIDRTVEVFQEALYE